MDFFLKQFWLFFVIATTLNAILLKGRSIKYIKENPELKTGYEKLFRSILIYGNIPWIIIGFGNITSITQSVFDYFNPKSLNPIVLIFHASIIILWILSLNWIYNKQGAEFLEKHPGLINLKGFGSKKNNLTAEHIKIFFPFMLLGGIIGMILMWTGSIPNIQ